jgi:hypothetical protein
VTNAEVILTGLLGFGFYALDYAIAFYLLDLSEPVAVGAAVVGAVGFLVSVYTRKCQ